MRIDQRVAPFLGRILDEGREPIGTCFQVAPGVLVTAWHVLDVLDAGDVGATVQLDPLQGGTARNARVERVDPLHDLAVLVVTEPLPGCVLKLGASNEVVIRTRIAITGVVVMDDPGHSYRHLDADGHWAGGSTRDGKVQLGRVVANAVMRGMSGAPVLAGQTVVGVVSARYNSGDGWGQDTVWVSRIEDVRPLLAGLVDVETSEKASKFKPQAMHVMSGDGIYVVGLDIRPGVYRTAGAAGSANCYYALLSSTDTNDVISNNYSGGPATITVGSGVKAVKVEGCQPWHWLGEDLDTAANAIF